MAENTTNTNNSNVKDESDVFVEVVEGVSKAGNAYKCLEIHVGEYSARVFPTPVELMYISHILEK